MFGFFCMLIMFFLLFLIAAMTYNMKQVTSNCPRINCNSIYIYICVCKKQHLSLNSCSIIQVRKYPQNLFCSSGSDNDQINGIFGLTFLCF